MTGVDTAGAPVRRRRVSRRSGGAVGQRRLYGWARLETAENLHGCDSGAGELGRDVAGDAGEAENLDMERRTGIRAASRSCRV